MLTRLLFILCLFTVSVPVLPADTLTVIFGGDVLFDRGVRITAEANGYDSLFTGVNHVFRHSDAAIVNLECPITMRHRPVNKKYIFRADSIAATAMHKAGITHAALANNHSVDQGLTGLSDTWRHLTAAGIHPIGYSTNPDSLLRPCIISKGDVRIAVFNAVTIAIENWFSLPTQGKPAIAYTSEENLVAAVRSYHNLEPSVPIVVFVHWGKELSTSPLAQQQITAASLSTAGASAVIGQHPHVVQPQALIGHTPVWYSIGNLVFDQKSEQCSKAQLVKLRFTADGLAGYETMPVRITDCRPSIFL